MRTDDLIKALAEDHAAHPQPEPLRRTFVAAIALGLGIAVVAFALALGIRPDVASAIGTWRFDFKLVMTLTLALTSARLVWKLARPAANARPAELAMAAAPLLLLAAVAYELWTIPEAAWLPRAIGANSVACVVSITLLSLAPLAAAFYALRRGAPLRPGFGKVEGHAGDRPLERRAVGLEKGCEGLLQCLGHGIRAGYSMPQFSSNRGTAVSLEPNGRSGFR